MKEMIAKILTGRADRRALREELYKIDPEEIYEGDNLLHSDAYFTLAHYISGEEEIREIEWVYLLKCLNGEEEFSFDSKMSLILRSTDKTKLIEDFVSASMAADRAQKFGNARAANELLDRKEKIRAALADDPASYKALLTPLLKHENARVRLEAACALLPVSAAEAEAALEELAKARGLTASKARRALKGTKEKRDMAEEK